MDHVGEGDAEEEIERFDDFTLASSWERFISEIEAICRLWSADGLKNLREKGAIRLGSVGNLYKAKKKLKYNSKSYYMEYYFEDKKNGKVKSWDSTLHELQLSFGVNDFLVISPKSASSVVLDPPEASKLLSAIAIALSNCSSQWPAFVPVHDSSRKAYMGIQNMGTTFTRRFQADYIGSQVPLKLMHLEGIYELFVSKFAFSTSDMSMHLFKAQFTMKLTYRTLPDDGDYIRDVDAEKNEYGEETAGEPKRRSQWDDDCPWSEWYSAEDPVKGFELITIWSEKIIQSSLEMAEVENSSPHEAETWLLLPTLSEKLNDETKERMVGFASQLSLLVSALEMSFDAQFLEDFVSVESGSDKLKAGAAIPPPTAVDRVLKELFHEGDGVPDFSKGEHKRSRAIKGAPLESLFAQFCLQSLWFGNCNIRAISTLWIEFVREVRWFWEESQPLPRMPVDGVIDLSSCLINQKLHMLAICIQKKSEANPEFYDATASHSDVEHDQIKDDPVSERKSAGILKKDSQVSPESLIDTVGSSTDAENSAMTAESKFSDKTRVGSAGFNGSTLLLNSYQRMHVPFTQDPPLMTEDMHEERLRAVEAFGDSFSFSAQLEREILLSDMSSFKAANPDAVFEDFIRWHSPGDWEADDSEEVGASEAQARPNWPPHGHLSKRMSEQGNFWRKLWNDAPALPADEQKPLLDPNREGEKVLHYLETVRPFQLLEQMICTAFRAAADTMNHTTLGDLSQMRSKLDQLYILVASKLRVLQVIQLTDEDLQDLRRLCEILEHVEKLTHAAASLHTKFLRAPRLSKAIFDDYYKFYLPRMGNKSSETPISEEVNFNKQQQVGRNERNVVAELFTPPTANQSWRKVLSMGNLLHGHEPVLREIVFTMKDDANGKQYAAFSPSDYSRGETETYRMYTCGSSNDLRVALSVVSCD
ncbi:hypothetical protein V2J09_018200 [Rumex salicifolius]